LNKALTQKQLDHLMDFIGYGRLDADIWFFVMEENGGSEDNLRARLKFEQLEDLPTTRQIPETSSQHSAWNGMCEIMLRLDDKEPDAEALQVYLANHLGSRKGATLVCPILPVPKSAGADWAYAHLLPQFSTPEACAEGLKHERLDLFRKMVEEHRPKIVVGIGKEHWADYQELFNQFKFSEHDQFMMGWDTDTVIILTEQLDAPEMGGKFGELVAIIRENALNIDTSFRTDIPIISEAELKRQKKGAARQAAIAKRKPSTTHDASDPYCVCVYCLKYEGVR
jgi:hypothetical protein